MPARVLCKNAKIIIQGSMFRAGVGRRASLRIIPRFFAMRWMLMQGIVKKRFRTFAMHILPYMQSKSIAGKKARLIPGRQILQELLPTV